MGVMSIILYKNSQNNNSFNDNNFQIQPQIRKKKTFIPI